MQDPAERSLSPENSTHRKYQALRAHFVDRPPLAEAARRFGYAVGTLRNLRAEFCKRPEQPFFLPDRRGKRKPAPGPDRDQRIVALRKEQGLSAAEIAERLSVRENLPVSASHGGAGPAAGGPAQTMVAVVSLINSSGSGHFCPDCSVDGMAGNLV